MKKISILIILLSLFSCNSEKKSNNETIEFDLIGFYEYKSNELAENHYIVIDTLDNKLNGFYFGTESSDEHGVFFYKVKMSKLIIKKNNIQFEIGERKLYENSQMKIIKTQNQLDREILIGTSKNILKYSGVITKSGFELNCESEFNDCLGVKMNFINKTE
ncbi:hypothetical protein [uncultured Lutibacter sp.]|uniref:hypothetical protein n=1 Tax=uncultured Lutibacter sp. TaxID=437739 RepID=UPI002629C860|nr:hypothetical protein [uncultured Lutibacter sp.]